MIISKPHGVIYVAVPKTASQSMSLMLERHLKEGDAPYLAESMHDFHASLEEAREATQELPLENYWSFAFVRNPFDRFISYCAGHVEGFSEDPGNALSRTIDEARLGENRWLLPQMHFISGVRKVYRFEYLNEALADLSARLGLDLSDLPRLNASEREPYAGYYTDELKSAVGEIYSADLLNLDYRF